MPAPNRCCGQAAAGIQSLWRWGLLDSRFRGNDAKLQALAVYV